MRKATEPVEAEPMGWAVLGDVPCLKNTLRVSGSGHFYHKDDAIAAYKEIFALQTPKRFKQGIEALVAVKVCLIRQNKRKDALNMVDTIADCLEYANIIKNDRQIVKWDIEATQFDKKNPRILLEVSYDL